MPESLEDTTCGCWLWTSRESSLAEGLLWFPVGLVPSRAHPEACLFGGEGAFVGTPGCLTLQREQQPLLRGLASS